MFEKLMEQPDTVKLAQPMGWV